MAKPRVFISSTFFDLRQVRADLDKFIKDLGYEPIRNEQGNIPYGKEEKLEEYCYREITNIDILVSIIGGRYGSASVHSGYSISQMEINTALKLEKQVFIFIEKNVYSEYQTYLRNKGIQNITFNFADNIKIYEFIEYLEHLQKNNPIQGFESSEDILHFLREQWAGLFQRYLQQERRFKEVNILQGLENTASTLKQLFNYFNDERKGAEDTIRDILISNHPAFARLKKLLSVPYRVFFLTRAELTGWLKVRSYVEIDEDFWDDPLEEEWKSDGDKNQYSLLKINSSLFDAEGNLKPIKKEEWSDKLITKEVRYVNEDNNDDNDDELPF